MVHNKIKNEQIFSVIITFILGTLLHFTYNFSGENKLIAIFSAINESVWEHLKLIYFPMLLMLIIGYFKIGKEIPNYICSKTIGIITAMVFIIIFFYTYTGILGKSIAIIDIASFYVAVILGEYISYSRIIKNIKCNNKTAILILISLLICFIIFTYYPPNLGIFEEALRLT